MRLTTCLARPFKIICKRILSYSKSSWSLDDYPIEYRKQKMLDLSGTNITMFPWEARIINWYWMIGDGLTKEESYQKLKEKFDSYVSEGNKLPRPGEKVELIFADVYKIDSLEEEAVKFFRDIFDMDYYSMFISDESSLYDFCWADNSINEKQKDIMEKYGVDICDIEGQIIVEILERIKEGTGIA